MTKLFDSNTFKPMDCPVCGQFYFTESEQCEVDSTYWLLLNRLFPDSIPPYTCHHCGWKYDLDQLYHPDSAAGENEISLNAYRKIYRKRIAENPEYDFADLSQQNDGQHICPICGKHRFPEVCSFDICPFCGWEDDGVMESEPEYSGGANGISIIEYRRQYREKLIENPDYKWKQNNK